MAIAMMASNHRIRGVDVFMLFHLDYRNIPHLPTFGDTQPCTATSTYFMAMGRRLREQHGSWRLRSARNRIDCSFGWGDAPYSLIVGTRDSVLPKWFLPAKRDGQSFYASHWLRPVSHKTTTARQCHQCHAAAKENEPPSKPPLRLEKDGLREPIAACVA